MCGASAADVWYDPQADDYCVRGSGCMVTQRVPTCLPEPSVFQSSYLSKEITYASDMHTRSSKCSARRTCMRGRQRCMIAVGGGGAGVVQANPRRGKVFAKAAYHFLKTSEYE